MRTVRAVLSCALTLLLAGPALAASSGAEPGDGSPETHSVEGALSGTIRLSRRMVRRPARFHIYPDPGLPSASTHEPTVAEEMAHVIVSLEPLSGDPGRPLVPGHHTMEQSGERFVPHVLPVVAGSTVEFPNADPMFHNVFSLSRAGSFDLGRYPRGTSRSVQFHSPGVVKVFCHIHSNMTALIVVLDTPFFTSPGPDGRYRLDGLPAGDYRAVAWHERAVPVERIVHIQDGGTSRMDFDIPVEDPSEPDRAAAPGGRG